MVMEALEGYSQMIKYEIMVSDQEKFKITNVDKIIYRAIDIN